VLVAGYTLSKDFPGGKPLLGKADGFVVRLRPVSWMVVYTTQFGGTGDDTVWGIALDSKGMHYLAGITKSLDLPVTPRAVQRAYGGGETDAFLAALTPEGEIRWMTYFGGSKEDMSGYDGSDIAVDGRDTVWIAGMTASPDLVLRDAWQTLYGGGDLDGFVLGLATDGSRVHVSSYHGGRGRDLLESITVGPQGSIFAAGLAGSRNLRSPRAHAGGDFDAMVIGIPTVKR
jgi:hypothetical protein